MRFLLLNQTFHPDVASSAQHLSDLAVALAERGHEVTVIAGRRAYDAPATRFAKRETWRGIRILRVAGTGFGKHARWRRAADCVSFLACCFMRMVLVRRPDVVIALTSPPLISVLAALWSQLRGIRFIYWVMDLNPDEAVAAGWLRPGSFMADALERLSRFSLRRAERIIALDRFMRERIVAKDIPAAKVVIVPPWSHDPEVGFDPAGRARFRRAHGLEGKFVVMYSGNHSPCHPLETLLRAAEALGDEGVVFCFIGGGSEWRKIRDDVSSTQNSPRPTPRSALRTPAFAQKLRRGKPHSALRAPHSALLCLPYQPLNELSASLSAADLHVVVMGEPFVGLVHPCKIYNLLAVGAAVLYIGPGRSHISELAAAGNGELAWNATRPGDVEGVIRAIRQFRSQAARTSRRQVPGIHARFSRQALVPELLAVLEDPAKCHSVYQRPCATGI